MRRRETAPYHIAATQRSPFATTALCDVNVSANSLRFFWLGRLSNLDVVSGSGAVMHRNRNRIASERLDRRVAGNVGHRFIDDLYVHRFDERSRRRSSLGAVGSQHGRPRIWSFIPGDVYWSGTARVMATASDSKGGSATAAADITIGSMTGTWIGSIPGYANLVFTNRHADSPPSYRRFGLARMSKGNSLQNS